MAQDKIDLSDHTKTHSTRLTPAQRKLCEELIEQGKVNTIGGAISYILNTEIIRREVKEEIKEYIEKANWIEKE